MRSSFPLVLSVLTTIGTAQQTWFVGPNDDLRATIVASAPGDVIVVRGTHPPFSMWGRTLIGPARIVDTPASPTGGWVDLSAGGGSETHVVDLQFESILGASPRYLSVGVNPYRATGGVVKLERCSFVQSWMHLRGGGVTMWNCNIDSSGWAAKIEGDLSAVSCSFRGGAGSTGYLSGSQALYVASTGTVHASFCQFVAGDASPAHTGLAQEAIYNSGPEVRLTDCLLIGGSASAGYGADCVVTTSAIRYARCHVAPGFGPLRMGASGLTGSVADPELLAVVSHSRFARGQLARICFRTGSPGVAIGAFFSPSIVRPHVVPGVADPLWFSGATFLVGAGMSDASGEWTLTLPVPASRVLHHRALHIFGLSQGSASLRAAPPLSAVVQ